MTQTAGDTKYQGWRLILGSVRTPLGFFTLLALILDGILLVAAATTDRIPFLAPLGLLTLIVVMVFIIVWTKPHVLYDPGDWQTITISLVFYKDSIRLGPNDIDLDVDKCSLEIRDGRAKQRKR